MPSPEQHAQTVTRFLTLAFIEGRPADAVSECVGSTYVQHSPTAEDGAEAFIAFATKLTRERPDLTVDMKRVIASDDLVAVHSHVTGFDDPVDGVDRGLAAVDIYRLDEAGRIVEHWDVLQPIAAELPHPNGQI
jgi:predicted SnoaL-like aldol condensation-catalyzing enzyme